MTIFPHAAPRKDARTDVRLIECVDPVGFRMGAEVGMIRVNLSGSQSI